MSVPVPAFLSEFRRGKSAAPPLPDGHDVERAPVSRKAAELAVRELRSILGQQINSQGVVTRGAEGLGQPLSPTVSVPSSPAPTAAPAPLDAATTCTTAAAAASREHGQPHSYAHDDDDDDIGGFFSYDARRRRQMMALRLAADESHESSSEEDSSEEDSSSDDDTSTMAPSHSTGQTFAFRERIARRSRATILRGGMLAACWASKMLVRVRARRAGRRLGPRSYGPVIPQKWLQSPTQKGRTAQAQAEEEGAYQAYLRLQMMEEQELSLSVTERILVNFPVWLLVPAALIIYTLLQLAETTMDGQREL